MANIKIFCEDCIFFVPSEPIPFHFGPPAYQLQKCLSPNNFKDSNATPNIQPISQPQIINHFNNCIFFSPKGSPSSSSSSSN